MKLIMENWKRFLNEAEDQEDGWKDLAMAGALGLGSLAAPAQAADTPLDPDPVTQTQDAQAETEVTFDLSKQNVTPRRIDLARTTLQQQAKIEGAQKLGTTPDNVKIKTLDIKNTVQR